MRPTIEQAYWSRDFDTVEAQKAYTKQGRGIATRVTKSGAGVDADRAKRALVQADRKEAVEFEGETAMDLYMTLRPRSARVRL
jgi:hypothetical protein